MMLNTFYVTLIREILTHGICGSISTKAWPHSGGL